METIESPSTDYHSNVDTSRPFLSVKEAVAVFGERCLTPEVYPPKPILPFCKQETFSSSSCKLSSPTPTYSHSSKQTLWKDTTTLVETIKKLENELQETKVEVKLLKERGTENEVALASLNAELHKNMSTIVQTEAVTAGKATEAGVNSEGKRRDLIVKQESSQSLAQILSYSQEELFGRKRKERKTMKKMKPIIPLVGDLLWSKKGPSSALHIPLHSSPHVQWN